jgi:transcriptional regulator with XRE-family HTH domain
MNEFGRRFKAARKALELTQEQVALAIEYKRTHIVQIESGDKKPSEEFMLAVARSGVIGIDLKTLKAWKVLEENEPEILKGAFQILIDGK